MTPRTKLDEAAEAFEYPDLQILAARIRAYKESEGSLQDLINEFDKFFITTFKAGAAFREEDLLKVAEEWCNEDLGMQNGFTQGHNNSADELFEFLREYCDGKE